MILVDSSVWIDFFHGNKTSQVSVLKLLIEEGQDVCTCGIVLAEVLQGIRDDNAFEKTKECFNNLIYLPESRDIFIKAACMYRGLRKKGFTLRKPVDCMIAAVSVFHDAFLLHSDRDFIPLQTHFSLKVVETSHDFDLD